jgi:4-amino-4-deoxy-L-arabinose transferase-like glycosyltransferase
MSVALEQGVIRGTAILRPWRRAARRAVGRVPWALWIALVATLNAACWSFVTPPFQVPDEPSHFAYVKELAETGRAPSISVGQLSEEESIVLTSVHFLQVGGEPGFPTIATQAEQRQLESGLASAARLPRDGSEDASSATSEPPLYYAIEAIPYLAADHGNLLERLQLMRLVSALMAGLTALFVFLFLREALPGESWAWRAGGLAVALLPLLGFMSGAVNPDAMLYAVSAALFFCLAKAFRCGLSRRMAVAIGVVCAVGLLTKLNFVGLLPGAFVGVAILSWRVARTSRLEALGRFALACVIAAGPILFTLATGVLAKHNALHWVIESTEGFAPRGSLLAKLAYAWELYLPRLPGMVNDFPRVFTPGQLWFNGFVGLYGWGDTPFPGWVYELALLPAVIVVCLAVRTLAARRTTLRGRASEVCVYALIAVGVMAMVAASSYGIFPTRDAEYAHVRYLFPLLAPLGAVLVLAARGVGRRWGPSVGVLIVLLVLAQDIFSQLLVVSHYYG